MLETAQKRYSELRFAKCNLPDGLDALPKVDLVFANACLQWVPDHPHLLPRLMEQLNPGGALAVQMPIVQADGCILLKMPRLFLIAKKGAEKA